MNLNSTNLNSTNWEPSSMNLRSLNSGRHSNMETRTLYGHSACKM